MESRAFVVLDAVDKISSKVEGAVGSFSGFGKAATLAGASFAVVGKAVDLALGGLSALNNQFSEAVKVNDSLIGLGGQLGALTNRTYSEGTILAKGLNAEFTKLGAALPGTTQDYKDLGLAISAVTVKANTKDGVFNEGAFLKDVTSVTKSLGLLQQTNKDAFTTGNAQLFFTRFVESGREAKLSILKLNQSMPGILTQVVKAQKQLGFEGRELSALSNKERLTVLRSALESLTPPEMIAQLQAQAGAQIEELKTNLFDHQIGLLGLLRDTNPSKLGDQSALASLGTLTKSLIGPSGFFATMGRTLSRVLGVVPGDPMALVVGGIDQLTKWIDNLGKTLTKVGGKVELGAMVGGLVAGLINVVSGFIVGLVTPKGLAMIGGFLGSLVAILGGALWGLVTGIDWLQLFGAVAIVAAGLVAWGAAAGVAVQIWATAQLMALEVFFLGQCAAALAGIQATTVTAVVGVIAGVGAAIALIVNAVTGLFDLALPGVRSKVGEFVGGVASAVGRFFEGIGTELQKLLGGVSLPSFGGGGGPKVSNHASGLGAGGFLAALGREASAMPSGAVPVVANSSEVILNRDQQRRALQRGGSSTLNFNPVFNISGSVSPSTLADQVLAELEVRMRRFA
jgi:hypothetical protein